MGKTKKEKNFIVHITRIERYEADVLVSAHNKTEALEKFQDAWESSDSLYETLTDNINCDSQTYKAHLARPGEKGDFDLKNFGDE